MVDYLKKISIIIDILLFMKHATSIDYSLIHKEFHNKYSFWTVHENFKLAKKMHLISSSGDDFAPQYSITEKGRRFIS